jgi:hypothetical protein
VSHGGLAEEIILIDKAIASGSTSAEIYLLLRGH